MSAWPDMIALVDRMAPPLAATVMVREQLALAFNRAGRGEDAERVLFDLLAKRGPSSETYGILGRVYKDRWEAASKRGETFVAQGLLDRAIDAYLRGFEADWRDAYPGVNAVTLMELKEPPDPRRHELIPVVRYAVGRRITAGKPDYWDHATRLELTVLAKDEQEAGGGPRRCPGPGAGVMGAGDHSPKPAPDPRGPESAQRGRALGAGGRDGPGPSKRAEVAPAQATPPHGNRAGRRTGRVRRFGRSQRVAKRRGRSTISSLVPERGIWVNR